ncbi:hypothetical protein PGTUg99_025914 [Puccinia graminis f. sp. tritici]|uniref:Uncharacterized protein n=1 Tax=Puccinia graminis f. sp. tritici TaxID=56615 RepID=A0A5B0SI10_PUCGR|nr:hypothetical protein PGTUg99_025914 [Puccinia graminis f. sp. tritici]
MEEELSAQMKNSSIRFLRKILELGEFPIHLRRCSLRELTPIPDSDRIETVDTQTPSGSGGSLRNGVPAPAERFRDLSGGSARLGYSIHRRTIDAAVLRDTATFAYRVYSLGTAHDKNYGNWLGTETVLSEQMLVVSD